MRPRFNRVLIAGVILAALSGCARVDLTSVWPAMAEPAGWEPKAGVCTDEAFAQTLYRTLYKPLDCTTWHTYETVYVGQFTGDAATRSMPPNASESAFAVAWKECDAKTTEYLGGPWQDGRLWFGVSMPSPGNWDGGARWFRCELMASSDNYGETPKRLDVSLKGAFGKASDLRFGCFIRSEGAGAGGWQAVDCGAGHNIEYVGSFPATNEYDKLKTHQSSIVKCRSLIAAYAGLPDDGNMKYRVGTTVTWRNESYWKAGDNWLRCFIWTPTRMLTGSAKGGGNRALPIQYR